MDISSLKEHLDSRLDKIEDKIDNHLERIAKAETSIEWIRGHIKVGASMVLAALSGMATIIYHFLVK